MSELAARTALAAAYQGRYRVVHAALMAARGALTVRSDDGVRYDLIVCYRQSGQMDRARAEFATLQKARPNDPDVQRLGQALR